MQVQVPVIRGRSIFYYLIIPVLVFLQSCNGGDGSTPDTGPRISEISLEGRVVYRLDEIDGALYAATDRGLFRRLDGAPWQRLGQAEWRILDWVILADGAWLLSTADGDDYEIITQYQLFESLDQGATWTEVVHDFGGDEEGYDHPEPIFKLLEVEGVLYATGLGVLAKSLDKGRTWLLVDGFWRAAASGLRALSLGSNGRGLWYGGQGGIENPVLRRVDVVDETTAELGDFSALLPSPSTIKSIRYNPFDASHVLVTGEGGLMQSMDEGASWRALNLNDNYRFYFDVLVDPVRAGRYVTAGWSKEGDNPQPLIVEWTDNGGQSWQKATLGDAKLMGGVYSMFARTEGQERVFYFGLFRGGVVRVVNLD